MFGFEEENDGDSSQRFVSKSKPFDNFMMNLLLEKAVLFVNRITSELGKEPSERPGMFQTSTEEDHTRTEEISEMFRGLAPISEDAVKNLMVSAYMAGCDLMFKACDSSREIEINRIKSERSTTTDVISKMSIVIQELQAALMEISDANHPAIRKSNIMLSQLTLEFIGTSGIPVPPSISEYLQAVVRNGEGRMDVEKLIKEVEDAEKNQAAQPPKSPIIEIRIPRNPDKN